MGPGRARSSFLQVDFSPSEPLPPFLLKPRIKEPSASALSAQVEGKFPRSRRQKGKEEKGEEAHNEFPLPSACMRAWVYRCLEMRTVLTPLLP